MTVKELMKFISTKRIYSSGGIEAEVIVEDVKVTFGKIKLQIKTLAGKDIGWVELDSTREV